MQKGGRTCEGQRADVKKDSSGTRTPGTMGLPRLLLPPFLEIASCPLIIHTAVVPIPSPFCCLSPPPPHCRLSTTGFHLLIHTIKGYFPSFSFLLCSFLSVHFRGFVFPHTLSGCCRSLTISLLTVYKGQGSQLSAFSCFV